MSIPALLLSCNRLEEMEAPENNDRFEDIDVTLGENQVLCGIPSTKTTMDEDLNVIWSEEDEIEVFASGASGASATYRFSSYSTDDKKYAVFECEGSGVAEEGRTAIYPASAYVEGSCRNGKAQISLGGITSVPTSSNGLSQGSDISALPLVATPSDEHLSFTNLCGGIIFRPYEHTGLGVKISKISVSSVDGRAVAGTATVNLSTGKIESFSGTETALTYTCLETDISKSRKDFVAYLPAGEYSQGITITIIDNLGRMFPLSTGSITINAGKVKKLPDVNLTISYGSANCVVVDPGTMSVRIDATPRYMWRSDYDMTAGKSIVVENGNLSHYGKDAKVVWQQEENSTATDLTTSGTENIIVASTPSVSFNDTKGTATLTVPLTGRTGNAVVSIGYGSSVAWSFHIWVGTPEETSIGGRTFLDRNLGASSITPGDRDSYGLCYQWGRKDPFPRILTDDAAAVSSYKSQGDLLKTVNKATGGTIAYTIQNPDTRITSSKSITPQNGDHWFVDNTRKNTRLWGCSTAYGSSSGNNGANTGTSIKTIFDPCPKGYKVPTYGDLLACTNGTKGSATNGRTLDGNYFPFGGFIRLEESFLTSGKTGWMTDTRGYLWSSISRSSTNEQGAYILKYNKENFNTNNGSATDPNGTGRGDQIFGFMCDAYPVRCVKETTSGSGSGSDDILPPALEEGEVLLNTVFDMNTEKTVVNSHSGLEAYSVLQPMHNNIFTLDNSSLTVGAPSDQKAAHYPRIKRLKDGGLVLFYQGGVQSSRIFTMHADSFNGLKNADPQMIFAPYIDQELTEANGGAAVHQRYMNMEAVVMPDGEIIGVVQHHAWDQKEVGYYKGQGTALELTRSRDGGETWTIPVEIYSGTCWEPYLLLLPDGTLQMYFTDSEPFLYSSQTSMMSSSDKGKTWSEKKVVARRFKFEYDGANTDRHGENVYTDQMPCFRLLNDGKTYAGFLEGRLETPMSYAGEYTSYHKMSLVKSSANGWIAITAHSQNALPSTRSTDVMSGNGGYIESFPSGETVISCSSPTGPLVTRILDSQCNSTAATWANHETTWFKPFGEKTGVWGTVERYNDNILMAAAGNSTEGLNLGLFYLNQQQTAGTAVITLDGNNTDWTTSKALFLSSEQGTEMILRFAHDSEKLYILSESCYNTGNEAISIRLKGSAEASVNLTADGSLSTTGDINATVRRGKAYDSRNGFCMEAGIPLSSLGAASGSTIYVYATVGNTSFTSANAGSTSTWQRVKIK